MRGMRAQPQPGACPEEETFPRASVASKAILGVQERTAYQERGGV